MAQRPTSDFNIDPNITSGTDLANILNRFQDAIDSGNSGASRPAYLAAGGLWVREGNPMRLYLYDGTTDRELYNTTDGIADALEDGTVSGQITTWNASSGKWTPEDALIVSSSGDVGIGNQIPSYALDVKATGSFNTARFSGQLGSCSTYLYSDTAFWAFGDAPTFGGNLWGGNATQNELYAYTNGTARIRIDNQGRVGIGGTPSRSAKEIEEEAEATLASWDSKDKKPTKAELIKRLTERTIGGGAAKLQVLGGAYFSSNVDTRGNLTVSKYINVNSNGYIRGEYSGELRLQSGTSRISFYNNQNNIELAYINNIGSAFFSKTVNATQFIDANGPIVSAFTMVEAFRKIKNAVADETTVEGIKESLTNVLGGLIEEFESIGTQES